MSKNKGAKGAQKSAVQPKTTEKKEEVKVQDKAPKTDTKPETEKKPEVKVPEQKKGSSEKPTTGLKEQIPPAAPAVKPTETADGTAAVEAEVVNQPKVMTPAQASAEVFNNDTLCTILTGSAVLTPETTMDVNHMVDLTKVATERFKGKEKNEPTYIAANEMLDDITCYCIAIAGLNMQVQGKKLGLSIPTRSLPAYVKALGFYGVALPENSAVPDPNNPGQMIIPFGDVDAKAAETIKQEIKIQQSTKPTMDPSLWKTEDDAKKAISYIMSDTLSKDNRFLVSLSKLRMYKMLNAENDEEKKMWENASNAVMFENLLAVLGTQKSTLLNAVGGQIYSAAVTRKNPILSHLTLKRNFPQCDDKEISEIVHIIVKTKAKENNPDQPIENNIAWIGLTSGKREDCLLIPTKSTKEDKEVMGRLQNHYGDKLGSPTEKGYNLKVTNLLVTLMNLYKTADFITQYDEKNYTEKVNEALKAVSGQTAPVEDKKLDAAAEKPATEKKADAPATEEGKKPEGEKKEEKKK